MDMDTLFYDGGGYMSKISLHAARFPRVTLQSLGRLRRLFAPDGEELDSGSISQIQEFCAGLNKVTQYACDLTAVSLFRLPASVKSLTLFCSEVDDDDDDNDFEMRRCAYETRSPPDYSKDVGNLLQKVKGENLNNLEMCWTQGEFKDWDRFRDVPQICRSKGIKLKWTGN